MATVETVNGPVDLEELGLTLIHEHFRATDEAARFQFPHLYDEDAEGRRHRRRERRQGPRRADGRRAERDVPPPRRALQQARGRRERA